MRISGNTPLVAIRIAMLVLASSPVRAQTVITGVVTPTTTLPSLSHLDIVATAGLSGPIAGPESSTHAATLNGQLTPTLPPVCDPETPRYYGGSMIQTPKVYVYYWGTTVPLLGTGRIENFYATILNSPYLDWLKEYDAQNAASTDVYAIRRGSYVGSFVDTTGVQTTGTIDLSTIQNHVAAMQNTHGIPPADANLIFTVFLPSTLNVYDDIDSSHGISCGTGSHDFCGTHHSNYPSHPRH